MRSTPNAASPASFTAQRTALTRLPTHWARSRGIPVTAFPAEWIKHGKAAGFRRNETMLHDGKPELVVAFPGSKGTAHMVRLATAAGVPVKRICNP